MVGIRETAMKRGKLLHGEGFCINDNVDVLIEILTRLDDKSLGVAACVCRLWCALTSSEALWEHLCLRHVSAPPSQSSRVKTVVVALGGYRRLYSVCVKPVLATFMRRSSDNGGGGGGALMKRRHAEVELSLSLSLFCVDYYERVFLGGGGGKPKPSPSSLTFLCDAVNL